MGFEACHPAVNFIFFASVIYGAVTFKHPVFLLIAFLCAFAYSVKRCGKRAVILNLCLLPLILAFALYYSSYHHFGVTVLKKNFINNDITLESIVYGLVIGLRFATLCMWLEAMFRVVLGQGGLSVRKGHSVAVLVLNHPTASYSQNRSGGKAYQPGSKGHWPGEQPRKYLQAYCQLLTNILYVDYMDDFGIGLGIRFYAFPWKPSPGTDSFLHLPLRQPGQGFCNWPVLLYYVDYHGNHPRSHRYVVQPPHSLESPGRPGNSDGDWLPGAVPDAHGIGALDGVPLSCRKKKRCIP